MFNVKGLFDKVFGQTEEKPKDNFPGSVQEMLQGRGTTPLKVSLGETRSVVDSNGAPINFVRFGLGWTPSRQGAIIDLDSSCTIVRKNGSVRQVWFRNYNENGVSHSGDNLTGQGDGEDEKIRVKFNGLDSDVVALYFTVHSFSGHMFNQVQEVFCRVTDETTGKVILEYPIDKINSRGGIMVARVDLRGQTPTFTATKQTVTGQTVSDSVCIREILTHNSNC